MDKLQLSDEILLSVEKPARYIGNEINCVYKDPSKVDIRFAFCFPDIYEIGMSHLGLQILYDLLNRREDTFCERIFSPWIDLHKILKERNIPLFALESQDPLTKFDFLGFTVMYEMCYTNILGILDLAGIPFYSKDRTDDDPLILAGGPCTYNPEPIADFFDFFYIGEGEVYLNEILDIYKQMKKEGYSRRAFLERISELPCVYVPQFYDVTYNEDGSIESFKPNNPYAKEKVKKAVVKDMSKAPYPTQPLVPFIRPFHERVVLELFRGCTRGCRFCQAGMVYRPVREKPVEILKEQATNLVELTGHEEISLISLSSSDYKGLYELSEHIIETMGNEKKVNLSLPSLRIDSISLDLMSKVQDVKKSSLTFAPEAGSQRLRNVINKGLTEEDILNGCRQAFEGGWNRVKLYFMLGLPTETMEDVEAIAKLSKKIVDLYYSIPKEKRSGRVEVVTSTSSFVPKPFTPFQWVAQDTSESFNQKHILLKKTIDKKYIKFTFIHTNISRMEGVMARGDRRLSGVIEKAYRLGAMFDAWTDQFNYEYWRQAFEAEGLDPDFYCIRQRSKDEILPWDFIDVGVTKAFLWREYERALAEKTTPNCSTACAKCGADIYGGDYCHES